MRYTGYECFDKETPSVVVGCNGGTFSSQDHVDSTQIKARWSVAHCQGLFYFPHPVPSVPYSDIISILIDGCDRGLPKGG